MATIKHFLSSHLKPLKWVLFDYFQNISRNRHFVTRFDTSPPPPLPPEKLRKKLLIREVLLEDGNSNFFKGDLEIQLHIFLETLHLNLNILFLSILFSVFFWPVLITELVAHVVPAS